ncbi:hypothetical protein Amsp01_070100 [Amycolatopsis sp. NBRC 101858]|jgi:hypothetical protein|uniref:DUF397 domain-containing protein n=1 Tax=Amycolatopsis mongoliensis TaxID=715475 RepID=A0A9Y2JVD8_9PSEU|nr:MULTISPECIES: DUF397 domain-containing protein [unclassified Amycolatopsis]WIY04017.1 DUF397 domain-containing protein [Amycolatopsis sp. 4-36]GLY40987.1 hypothetical protein Amsp01_070100 [Amycolatopsis sp. NBRC 101858]
MADYPSFADYDPNTAVSLFQEAAWEKSFASEPNGGSCVEVNLGREGLIGVRDTKLATSPVFVFDTAEWEAFLVAVKAGQFDLPA